MKIKIARDELLTGLQRVQGIVEKRNTMPVLSSEKKVTMKLVGTDGHRLAIAESELANAGTDLPKEVKAIIPRKAAQEMRRLLEEEEGEPLLGFTKNLVTFQKSGLYLTSRVMEGTYPNYQQVIPKESAKKAVIERAAMEAHSGGSPCSPKTRRTQSS